jgi:hypothetical protein
VGKAYITIQLDHDTREDERESLRLVLKSIAEGIGPRLAAIPTLRIGMTEVAVQVTGPYRRETV